MPKLTTLQVENLRNLQSVDLEFSHLITVFFGSNGSGKTSLLEAISILAHGRSFRTRKYKNIIHRDQDSFLVFSKIDPSEPLEDSLKKSASIGSHEPSLNERSEDKALSYGLSQGLSHSLSQGISLSQDLSHKKLSHQLSQEPLRFDHVGISRSRKGVSQFRLNGSNISSANQLAQNLPLLCVNNSSFNLLDGGPIERRMFLDWLVFHVKHDFGVNWKQYTKCVKQRNSLLRRDNIRYADIEPWDKELARLALTIENSRQDCLPLFQDYTMQYLEQCDLGEAKFSIHYINGWMIGDKQNDWIASEENILNVLKRRFEKDKALGYSSIGSHKSDLKILIEGKPVSEILSRGQQKVLIMALYFAKAHVFIKSQSRRPVFLLDDLSAELDPAHLYLLGKWLHELNVQSFITTVSCDALLDAWRELSIPALSMFHVKQGSVTHEPVNESSMN